MYIVQYYKWIPLNTHIICIINIEINELLVEYGKKIR